MSSGNPVVDRMIFVDRSEISNPPSGFRYVYINSSGRIVVRNPDGTEFVPGTGGGGGGGGASIFPTMSSLVAEDSSDMTDGEVFEISGYNNPGDGGAGMFMWDSGSTSSTVRGFIVAPNDINPSTQSGRLIRLHESEISVLWAGITPGSDSGEIIQEVIDYASTYSGVATVRFPGVKDANGNAYRTSTGITCPYDNVNIIFDEDAGDLEYTSTDRGVIFEIGAPNVPVTKRSFKISVYRPNKVSSWSDMNEVGIRFINTENCKMDLRALNSTVNVEFRADGDGVSYNRVFIQELRTAMVQILLSDQNGGWVNQNTFYGGRLWNSSSDNGMGERYGVLIRSVDGQYGRNNNNYFLHTNFELRGSALSGDKAVAIVLQDNARDNYFIKPRLEGCDHGWRLEDDSFDNFLDIGYSPAEEVEDGLGGEHGNIVENEEVGGSQLFNHFKETIFHIKDLPGHANYWNAEEVYIDGMAWGSSGNDIVTDFTNQMTLTGDYLEVPSNRIFGVMVDTEHIKEFLMKISYVDNMPGRRMIRCYDGSGNVIADESVVVGNVFYQSGYSGGAFRSSGDEPYPTYLRVAESVKRAFLGFTGGTSNARLTAVSIMTRYAYAGRVVPGYTGSGWGVGKRVGAEPAAGIWKQGEIAWNGYPSASEPVGWMCLTTGEFGTATEPTFGVIGTLS